MTWPNVAESFWGTYHDDRTSQLSHLSTFSSHLTDIIRKKIALVILQLHI